MAEPQRNKDGIGEKPQWTTRQVIAFVAALASIAGFGSSKAYDYAMDSIKSQEQSEFERRPIVRDTSIALIVGRLSSIESSIISLQTEISTLRTDSKQNYSDLREDLRSMNKRIREYERAEYTMREH